MAGFMVKLSSSAPDITEQFTTAITGANTTVMTYVGIAVGAALGIIIAVFAVKKGISFFKTMANKA
jgi:hypothetical protein